MNGVKINSFMYSPIGAYTWRLTKEVNSMARIPEELIDSVVYFYPSVTDAKKGTKAGGTGFLIGVRSKHADGFFYLYVVTNRHIIGEKEANSLVMRVNTKEGKFTTLTTLRRQWYPHPHGDDVAVCPVLFEGVGNEVNFVPDDMFLPADKIEEFNIGPGDDVALIGRFIHHEGRERNLPAVRFGNIAMMPDEPLETPTGIMQESYLVEMHSISGFSGSPAFVERQAMDLSKVDPGDTVLTLLSKYKLLGVDWGHILINEPVVRYDKKDKLVKHPEGWKVRSNSAMMGVVPIWKVMDILNEGQLADKRDKDEKILKDELDKAKKAKKQSMPESSFSEDSAQLTESEFNDVLKRVSRKTEEQWKRDNPHLTKASESDPPKSKT